jgi:hypothetical protein
LLDEAETVGIGVPHVHFAAAPGLIDRFDGDADAFGYEFGVKRINSVHDEVGHPAGNAIAGKGRKVQPNAIAGHTHVTGIGFGVIGAMCEFAAKTELVAIEVLCGGGAGHVKEGDGYFKHGVPRMAEDILLEVSAESDGGIQMTL